MVADHITTIRFELNTLSFYLPSIKLDVNSEVIIRNLVSYEAMIMSESDSLILTRYLELMKGLVDSAEDVKVLKGIIQSKSIKEDEVVKLFSGMNKSIRFTNTHELDDAIAEVNRFYNGLWMVSATKFFKKWRRTAWNFCKVFAALLFLLLMAIQAFCSVYQCPRLSLKSNSQAQHGLRVPSLRSYV
ncbi:hypothetical protein TorRG33x02_300090 [Trema orientale]|uniref:Uncharacterized protein n=1 Tax=Trema orientale TaxID=63057 RepID=A0A2P5C2E1_TREOI|nr:hypothetical protein TorRG33x02_300090 [Trema orientale]